jgi:light-harvesting complex I chlorophyll a/b binding protein 1
VLLVIGTCEAARISQGWNSLNAPATEQIKDSYNAGELGFDPLGLFPTDAAAAFELQTKELNNGRLAMISVAGFAVQEEVDHITIWRSLVEDNVIPAAEANLLPY